MTFLYIDLKGIKLMDDFEKKDEEKKENIPPLSDEKKPEEKPEDKKDDKAEEKPGKGKKNPYEEYKYWGSEKKKGNGPAFKGGKPNRFALVILILLILSFVYMIFNDSVVNTQYEFSYSTFINLDNNNKVRSDEILDQSTVNFITSDGLSGTADIPYADPGLLATLEEHNVDVAGGTSPVSFWYILLNLLPWIIFIFFMVMIFRQAGAQGGGKMMNSFGKSHAQKYDKKDNNVKFSDVAGQKEAKYELEEVVDFLKHPEKYVKIGARIPKGVLLVGPPGTGKTLLARAVAGEAGVSFFHTSGSDFVEMFVGMGAARVRDLFEQARKNSPCIIFIDELDAVGRARGTGLGGGHDEREQTLNQLLVEMDGFSTAPGIIVMAATNRPDVLDPALLRPGRFDRQVVVDLPDVQERLDILRIHTKKVTLDPSVDLERIARATPGTSGADIANLVNEAALYAARSNRMAVDMNDFENARDKILLGVARESRFMTEEEKRATAYHESGHTLMHYYLKTLDPLHKVTIIPHGRALGITMSLPEKDVYSRNQTMLEDMIKMIMGGYAAEKIVYGVTTTGTSNDNQKATEIARRMVTEWGMSELGFVNLSSNGDEPIFLGREIAQHKDYSDYTARRIDEEVEKILSRCMKETLRTLTEHRDQLDQLTEALVEKETLDDAEIRAMFNFPEVEHVTKLV